MNFNRILSLVVFVVYLAIAIKAKEASIALLPLVGLPFIWFPSLAKFFNQFGSGMQKAAPMDPNTPSCVFIMIGWGILLFPLFVGLIGMLAEM